MIIFYEVERQESLLMLELFIVHQNYANFHHISLLIISSLMMTSF